MSNAQRLVLVEEFTQASCPPCEASTPQLNATLIANEDKVVQIRYQTSWPGVDPMNADNPGEVQSRVDYYGVTGVPNVRINGKNPVGATFPELVTTANINSEQSLPTDISMTLTHSLSDDLATANVTATVTNNSAEVYNIATNRLRIALVEEEIKFINRPGSTSILDYEYVMKTFFTTAAGMALPEIPAGETWEMTWSDIDITGINVYDFDELAVVGWVQNDADLTVANAAVSHAQQTEGYADLSVVSTSSSDGGLCDYEFSGSAQVTNTHAMEVPEYTVSMLVNGAAVQSQTVTEVLAPNATTDITFDEVTLPPGASAITYIVETPTRDIGVLNNTSLTSNLGKAAEVVAMLNKDYESDNNNTVPANAIVDRPFANFNMTAITPAGAGQATAGAYGESANSVIVNFYGWNPASVDAEGFMIIGERYEATAETALSFDWAYTSFAGSQDRMQVQISTDCGETYTDVFNRAGADLATAPEVNSNTAIFIPSADQWESARIDLSEYAGETILVRMFFTSDWGDMLFFDNVVLNNSLSLTDLQEGESLEVYPNPAHTTTTIDLNITDAALVQVTVIDMLGRTVDNVNLGTQSGRVSHSLDVSNYDNGTYLVYVKVGDREAVERISVLH